MTALGIALGLAGAWAGVRLLRSLLDEVVATVHWTSFAVTPILLIAVVLVASSLPARRAAGVDPASTLREE